MSSHLKRHKSHWKRLGKIPKRFLVKIHLWILHILHGYKREDEQGNRSDDTTIPLQAIQG